MCLSIHLQASLSGSPSSSSPSFSFLGDFWNFTLAVHAVRLKNGPVCVREYCDRGGVCERVSPCVCKRLWRSVCVCVCACGLRSRCFFGRLYPPPCLGCFLSLRNDVYCFPLVSGVICVHHKEGGKYQKERAEEYEIKIPCNPTSQRERNHY